MTTRELKARGRSPSAADEMAAGGLSRLAELILAADCFVVLTGAGVSVPSGIPDFRSAGTGLWEKVNPMEVAHIDVFRRAPERFWHFYGDRFASLEHRRPNGAHRALVDLESRHGLDAVITQNIDMLHRKAGTRELVEVHGSIEHSSCMRCGASHGLDEVRRRLVADPRGVPRCDCREPLKPDVVLFGEHLPEAALREAEQLAMAADVLLCVGSSLEVYPVAALPGLTRRSGGAVAIATRGPTPFDDDATVRLGGDVVAELEGLVVALDAARS